jgi:hypothetical protein
MASHSTRKVTHHIIKTILEENITISILRIPLAERDKAPRMAVEP